MAIPAKQIVSVTPRVISAGGTDLEISGLFLTKNELAPFGVVKSFTSARAVAKYFGEESDEYKAAVKYFLGYDDSFVKPKTVYFARSASEALAGALIGGACGTLDALKAVTAGAVTVVIDGKKTEATALDFSSISTYSDVSEILAAKLGADVTYNSNIGGFIITSKATGETSRVKAATGDSADVLGLSEAAGAVESVGSGALTPAANMDAVTDVATNWVTFTTLYEADEDEIIGLAQWSNDQDVDYLYCPYTTSAADTLPSNKSNLPNKMKELNLEGVALTYGGLNYAILIMAIAGSIDWNRENGLPTFKFKSQSGLAASVIDETTSENLIGMNVNYYGRYATRADEFILFAEGAMLGGDYGYIDTYLGMVWLKNKLQRALMSGLTSIGRVPYTDSGYTIIHAWMSDPITQAKLNGVIQAGVSLSQAQKAQLINEIGEDVSNTIYTDGYYVQVDDPGANARANRESPTIGIWYTYGGAVHKLDVPLALVE